MMTRTARVDITFPKESEVRAAVQGRRELTARVAASWISLHGNMIEALGAREGVSIGPWYHLTRFQE